MTAIHLPALPARAISLRIAIRRTERRIAMDRDLVLQDKRLEARIRFKAWQLSQMPGFSQTDREDIRQRLWMAVLEQLPRYDPSRVRWHTFAQMVIECRAASIARERMAACRDPLREKMELDAGVFFDDVHEEWDAGHETIAHDFSPDPSESDFADDLVAISKDLTQRQRDIMKRLSRGQSKTAVAKAVHVGPDTLALDLHAIRERMVKSNMHEYLNN